MAPRAGVFFGQHDDPRRLAKCAARGDGRPCRINFVSYPIRPMATARNLLGNRWESTRDLLASVPADRPSTTAASAVMAKGSQVASRLNAVQRAAVLVAEAQALLEEAAATSAGYDLRLAQGLAESLLDRLAAMQARSRGR